MSVADKDFAPIVPDYGLSIARSFKSPHLAFGMTWVAWEVNDYIVTDSTYSGTAPHAFSEYGILNKIAYSTGIITNVKTVANSRPPMMMIDMLTKKASCSSGIMPKIVVAAARPTGRRRLTVESRIA